MWVDGQVDQVARWRGRQRQVVSAAAAASVRSTNVLWARLLEAPQVLVVGPAARDGRLDVTTVCYGSTPSEIGQGHQTGVAKSGWAAVVKIEQGGKRPARLGETSCDRHQSVLD